MLLAKERGDIADYGRRMLAAGLTTGTGGNLSVIDRGQALTAISPSGVAYEAIRPEDVVVLDAGGQVVSGALRPSSEVDLHRALYAARPDIGAVVHTHSLYATAFACLGEEIPAVHYLIAWAGDRVPLAPYATFGTPELACAAVAAIGGRNAVLLQNHGLVAVGPTLAAAFTCAEAVELVARLYHLTRTVGTPRILPEAEMARVQAAFATYGQPPRAGA